MRNRNGLPWTEADEAFIHKISGFIHEALEQARTAPEEEWDLVPTSARASGLATAIFCTLQKHRDGRALRLVSDRALLQG